MAFFFARRRSSLLETYHRFLRKVVRMPLRATCLRNRLNKFSCDSLGPKVTVVTRYATSFLPVLIRQTKTRSLSREKSIKRGNRACLAMNKRYEQPVGDDYASPVLAPKLILNSALPQALVGTKLYSRTRHLSNAVSSIHRAIALCNSVQRAAHGHRASVEDMGINHRRSHILVA
jgi:hypothetical protein